MDLLEHFRFIIAAADDCDMVRCLRESFGVKDESGGRDCAARLGDRFRIRGEIFHCLVDFVFVDCDDVVDVSADVLEIDGADALRAEAVCDRAADPFGGELNDLSLPQAGSRVGSEFGFDTDDFHLGIRQLDGGGDAGDEASAADGSEDGFNFRKFLENFETNGALSGNDVFVVVGRHDDVSMLGGEFFGSGFALVGAGADQNNFRSEFRGGLALDLRGVVRHHDDRFRFQRARSVGDTLRVISARIGDYAAIPFFVRQRSDLVVSATELEGADGLLVLGLQEKTSRVFGTGLEFDEAGAFGDAVEAGLGGAEVGKGDHSIQGDYNRVSLRAVLLPLQG